MSSDKDLTANLSNIRSVGSHLAVQDHEVDLDAVLSNQLSLGQVASTLTDKQKYFVLKRLHFDALTSLENLPPTVLFIFEKIEQFPIEEAVNVLEEAIPEHKDDPNIQDKDLELWKQLLNYQGGKVESVKDKLTDNFANEKEASIDYDIHSDDASESTSNSHFDYTEIVDWNLQIRLEGVLVAYWSPYPEVRSVTYPYDDPTKPVETLRVYIVGTIWVGLSSVINTFFADRQPSIYLAMSAAQVFLYPSGKLLEWILPNWSFKIWKYKIDLNPGPYTYKEQMLVTILLGVSIGGSYVTSNITIQKLPNFYNNDWADWGYQVLLILSTNFLGIGLAGIMRKFAVYPIKSIWPTILPTLALNRALLAPEKKENINGWTISRYYFFFIVFFASFLYYWIPDYLFQALSTFNWMTWIKPDNLNLATITGMATGLGLNPISTFDFNVILMNSPLETPFFNYANLMVGMFISFFAIVGVWYNNYKWAGYVPINSNSLFTNTGDYYSVRAIVNENSSFDNEKYQEYGPPFYSASNLVSYGAFFALYPFHFVYEIGIHYKQLWDACKSFIKVAKDWRTSTYEGYNDPHSIMMRAYPEVPEWAFLIVLIISLVFAILCVELYPKTETPVWAIFFALGINFVFLIPLTTIQSRTGFGFGLNVLVELIIGYALPGKGIALSIIKAIGYNIDGQAQNYISDQKMAHYSKIPPRAIFRAQLYSIFIASFIQLGILNWMLDGGIKDYCMPHNSQKFTCPGSTTFYTASVIWGVIGPKKVFNNLYPILRWCFLIGFLLAFPAIAFKKYGPRRIVKCIEPSIIIAGFIQWAPYNLSYYIPGLYASFAFMFYIRRKYEAWWQKYNYLVSTGVNGGIAFSSIIIFFAVMYHDKSIDWWGNSVPYVGLDGAGISRLNATLQAPDGYFGPREGHYP
ncbi:unnamed protein product [Candida verbasci]|uniref:Oligopeptide transporter 2 n=1 Tax=Candida verbasci TaxID=1227364 RepID=A0A9W4X8A1_9ASCO|nr:unnamed protein product [Candida verbasci]